MDPDRSTGTSKIYDALIDAAIAVVKRWKVIEVKGKILVEVVYKGIVGLLLHVVDYHWPALSSPQVFGVVIMLPYRCRDNCNRGMPIWTT